MSKAVHIKGKEWNYKIGRGNIVISNPITTKKHLVGLSTLTGRASDVVERGRWKKTSDGMIKPSDVKKFIERNLL